MKFPVVLHKDTDSEYGVTVPDLPEHLLAQIDSFAAQSGDTRSGFLAHAAMEYVTSHRPN